jgi:hypothetical protein
LSQCNLGTVIISAGSSALPFKRLIRNSQEYFDFLRFSRGRRGQGVEVFEETGPRKTGGAKVPFDNFNPENYLGNACLRNAATQFASPVTRAQGVENALRGNFDLRLERRPSTHPGSFPSLHASGHCIGDPLLLEFVIDKIGCDCDGSKIDRSKPQTETQIGRELLTGRNAFTLRTTEALRPYCTRNGLRCPG